MGEFRQKENFRGKVKRCFTLLLCLCMVAVLIPVSSVSRVQAEETYTDSQKIVYTIDENASTASVSDGSKATGAVVIPDTIKYNGKNYDVVSIGEDAFYKNSDITAVTIGDNVTSIGNYAFCCCENLASATLGSKVEIIGELAFMGTALTKIILPDSVNEAGMQAFYGCLSLADVTIGSGLKVISTEMFMGCVELTRIFIPQNVTYVNSSAFGFCGNLAQVTICNSNLTINGSAFNYCASLQSIYIQCNVVVDDMFNERKNTGIIPLSNDEGYEIMSGTTPGRFYRLHNITYTATNQTISAKCSIGDVTNAGSITLVAPSDTSYTGSAVEATYTGSFDTAYVTATPVIKYTAKSGSALTNGKPVEPGTYTASITVGTATVSVEYTISGKTNSLDENEDSDGDGDDYDTDSDDDTQTASSSGAQVLNVASDNVVASDAPVASVTLENSTDELLSSGIFTTAEKRRIANGNSAKVYVSVDSLSAENVSQADRDAIESAAAASLGDNYTIQYMDMSLFKQVGSEASQKVSKTGTDIKVTVGLSENMINTDENVSRKYVVISLYDGEAATIEPTYEPATNKLTFSTNSFSTFAIAFTQEAAMGQLSASSPKTGDTANIPAMLALMAVAGMMMVCLARCCDTQ